MVNLSGVATSIKGRKLANDVFITPLPLAKKAIDMVGTVEGKWLDPFKATGNYFNQFPTENKDYTEITEDLDFFNYTSEVDVICSNPPYSLINDVLAHSVKLNPKVINYLIGINNLTPKRIEFMNTAGYYISKIHITNVKVWFGMSIIIQFEKCERNIITFDRMNY
jgi:hypothetical protein